jgi:SAM-dependent methyltransferase
MRLCGVELTQSGVEAARAIAELPRLPQIVDEFVPLPLKTTALNGAIEFKCGNARALPFADRSFDIVYTSLALEQMEEIRAQALAEIARVAKRWVIMVEPFRDFNDDALRRSYIKSQDYFSARVADLADYGLKPIVVSADMPHKVTLKPAFVIAST